MKILVIGTGYVGLVQGVCLAELGNEVVCIDVDETKIENLKKGISPIYEPGIEELVKKNFSAGRIKFDTSIRKNIKDSEIIFIAVGTPSDEDGRADLQYVLAAAKDIGKAMNGYRIIVNKSTVPIGTGELVKKTIKKYYKGDFDVVSNPEFLREGSAIDDFMHPDRIILGDGNGKASKKITKLYGVLNAPVLVTNLETAEMIKYASNSYLATQISYINSIAGICEKVGADVNLVSQGMKLDRRIGKNAFLSAGLGYGGSCFPKDVKALIQIAADNDTPFTILEEVEVVNKLQRQRFILRAKQILKTVEGKTVAVWGIAFKPKTDDIREAPSITILEALSDLQAKLHIYDPFAEENVQKIFPNLKYFESPVDACIDADILLIVTEWDEFRQINLEKVKKVMSKPVILDGRNIYDPTDMKELGFVYHSMGRSSK